MFYVKYLYYFIILIHLVIGSPQLNLYYTNGLSESQNESQHNCLRVAIFVNDDVIHREIISYCMSELPLKFDIEKNDFVSNFTFAELSKQNITNEQLYFWSAPIDIIEDYQFYLNKLSIENDLSLGKQVFYNCTIPRFGPQCQYQLYYHKSDHSSLYEIVNDFYSSYKYNPTNLTCYTHLKCSRGPSPSCLDWTEICDGTINCLNGGFDEEHCWQLEINQCKDNEYRCLNGQCIPQSFHNDGHISDKDCLDSSDENGLLTTVIGEVWCSLDARPSFRCEDISCSRRFQTSSCSRTRPTLLLEAMHSRKDRVSLKCWAAFKCFLDVIYSKSLSCDEPCEQDVCIKNVENTCPDMIYFPNVPVIFDNLYFVYKKDEFQYWINISTLPLYICYNTSQYDHFFINISKIFINNMTCVHSNTFLPTWAYFGGIMIEVHKDIMSKLYQLLKPYHLTFNYTSAICNRSNVYQCVRSVKCISIYRLMDGVHDCPHMDDENFTAISNTDQMEYLKRTYFKCQTSGKYFHQYLIEDNNCDCEHLPDGTCDDENILISYIKMNILFQHICDGFTHLNTITTEERNETDETECQQWPCNNIYSRCRNLWNCPNGANENGCISNSTLNCSSTEYLCVSSDTNQLKCLPIEKVNDGNIDCFGATDESRICGIYEGDTKDISKYKYRFHCSNQTSLFCLDDRDLCNGLKECKNGDDEQFCRIKRTIPTNRGICHNDNKNNRSNVENFLCDHLLFARAVEVIYFKLDGMIDSDENLVENIEHKVFSNSSMIKMSDKHQPLCHRGLDLLVWLNNELNLTINKCLCPPSFYGSQCQYQNQRVSLTIKFRALASSLKIPFAVIISLIDDSNNRIIHSYEQFTYLSIRNCQTKFNIYLLYSTRPKDLTKNYLIQIDFYEKLSLIYRGSLIFPVNFPFLPVYRLSLIVNIPRSDDKTRICSNKQCIHGKCIKYSNNPSNLSFCQCDIGWSEKFCNIQHICSCSSDSLCIGISSNNRSICVCPINKFGPRCFITDRTCQINKNSTCQNGGQCISNFDYKLFNEKFFCICPKGFSGTLCEIADSQLILSFEKDIILSQEIFIHFIDILSMRERVEFTGRATTLRRIPVQKDLVIIYWSQRFHLVFTELSNKNYYLTVIENNYNQSTNIIKLIKSSDRCRHIRELFNETFIKLHLIRRIKYYHLPCQKESLNISCFYDEIHFCLCYQFEGKRLANCFKFDHNISFDCLGQNECENGGQCLQDRTDCATSSICICPPCFYGSRCQFDARGFGLSLDAILGYHILQNVNLNQQTFIIKFSLSFTVIFLIIGLINGILSLITFKNKIIREVGCGLYLFGSSITTLFTMIMFGLKFFLLLFSQMTIISNRSFLQFQCHSVDFLLRICLFMDQWLNACVALERAITTIKGAAFSKKKSKRAAKFVILIVLIVIICTSIHDPIYRRLIDEENDTDNEKRIWCTVDYSIDVQRYNHFIYTFHFLGPFLINLISSIVLITTKSRQQLKFHRDQTYKTILREQFRQHKHLLIGPIVLVILAFPRLIILFLSKCMKSSNESLLFLCGYLISFIPTMVTFFVFILPSKFYMKELNKTILQYRNNIQRRLHLKT